MFKAVLAKTVSRIHGTEPDPDGTLRSPPCAVRWGHMESARWATRWCHFHVNGQTLAPPTPTHPVAALPRGLGGETSFRRPYVGLVGLCKGTLRARRPTKAASHPF